MKTFFLFRIARREDGAFGVLLDGNEPFAVTLEQTDENLRTVIPAGAWRCTPRPFYKKGYDSYEVLVPGHTALLFHKGNWEKDTRGCILVAKSFTHFDGLPLGIAASREGFDEFMKRTGGEPEIMLHVKEVW